MRVRIKDSDCINRIDKLMQEKGFSCYEAVEQIIKAYERAANDNNKTQEKAQ